jgi:hypothetical protein
VLAHELQLDGLKAQCLQAAKEQAVKPAGATILDWLRVAVDVRAGALRQQCFEAIRSMPLSMVAAAAAAAAAPSGQQTPPPSSQGFLLQEVPAPVVLSATAAAQRRDGRAWCGSCRALFVPVRGYGGSLSPCGACGSSHAVPSVASAPPIRWFKGDKAAVVSSGVKALSREALEDLLAAVVVSASDSYCNQPRSTLL